MIVESRQVLVREEAGPVLAVLQINRDITEQRRRTAKEAEYLKDEFVGIAAHELRTPLAVLAGYADMLLTQTWRLSNPE